MKKLLLLLLTLLGSTAMVNAQVSFTNNQGNLSVVFYVTNFPPDVQVEMENVWRLHAQLCTTNQANRFYTPSYLYSTNYVQSGVDTNNAPVFSQVVTTNAAWTRQGMCLLIADPSFTRSRANILEIVREWLGLRRNMMSAERLRE
jgi:hypothetical protein